MKKVFLILACFFFLFGCKEKEYSWNDLEEKNGISYIKGSSTPYTGETKERLEGRLLGINVFENGDHVKGTSFYPNGNMEYEIEWKNGKENGYWRQYFFNGQLDYETYKIDGIINGVTKSYYENGQLKSEYNFVDNKIIGNVLSYYENGQLRTKLDSLENGFTYYEDGKIKSKIKEGKNEIYYNREGKEVSVEEIKQHEK